MKHSTTYQSKILRTKKRLSDDGWMTSSLAIGYLGLIGILTFALRATAVAGLYGEVPVEMPVLSAALDDPGYHKFREQPYTTLKKTTPAVVLTPDGFYFGDARAFTTNFDNVHDKFLVRHVDGRPQLTALITSLDRWSRHRAQSQKIGIENVLIFAPSGDIPMPIVTQVVAGLRKSAHFNRIILATGLR